MTRQMMGHDNSTPTCKGHGIREQASSFAVGRAGVDCQVEVAAGAVVVGGGGGHACWLMVHISMYLVVRPATESAPLNTAGLRIIYL